MSITTNYQKIRREIPENVSIVLAAKNRAKDAVREAIEAGATDIGENYVQEAQQIYSELADDAIKVKWHMIGSLQKNKINKALPIFDVVQTVDSVKIARAIDKRVDAAGKGVVPVYIEINIGSEITKAGVKPKYILIENLVKEISQLEHIRLDGLMTMGPRVGDPEKIRPYFRHTKDIFDKIKSLNLPRVTMKTLSMGMSNSYKIAIEEGSTMIRLGTIIFGRSKCDVTWL